MTTKKNEDVVLVKTAKELTEINWVDYCYAAQRVSVNGQRTSPMRTQARSFPSTVTSSSLKKATVSPPTTIPPYSSTCRAAMSRRFG